MLRFLLNYLFLLETVNDPDTFMRFIQTTFMSDQLRNVCCVCQSNVLASVKEWPWKVHQSDRRSPSYTVIQ